MVTLKNNTLTIQINTFQAANHYVNLTKSILNLGIASIGTVDDNSLAEGLGFVRDILPDSRQVEDIVSFISSKED